MKKKYPWEKLQKVGDSFVADVYRDSMAGTVAYACKKYGFKVETKKIQGGTLVTRVA